MAHQHAERVIARGANVMEGNPMGATPLDAIASIMPKRGADIGMACMCEDCGEGFHPTREQFLADVWLCDECHAKQDDQNA